MEELKIDLMPLEKLLKSVIIPKKTKTSNRRNFPLHRAVTFGIVKGRYNGIIGLSGPSIRYPEIFEEIIKIGDKYCPFQYTSIHLNNNVVCPKHKDSNNCGVSTLISFGDYTGCNIVIEDEIFDAKYNPITFNGSEKEHWNTDDLKGNKYSLVFYCQNHEATQSSQV
jgi:hypothetical protein